MKNILVTGGTGFIGSHLCEILTEYGYNVTAYDQYNSNNNYNWLENSTKRKEIQVVLGDVRDADHLQKYIKKIRFPGTEVKSQADFENYARQYGRTSYHPTCTCKMGVDEMSVVDPKLRVRGIDGLRVCDSSVMPSLVGSNTNAPTIMIGEKAADLVRGNY